MISRHVLHRLDRFSELLTDQEYTPKRAIAGLKTWTMNNAYRLTDLDKKIIASRIKTAECDYLRKNK